MKTCIFFGKRMNNAHKKIAGIRGNVIVSYTLKKARHAIHTAYV